VQNHNSMFNTFYFYCPLFIFILEICPEHNSKSNQTTYLKFQRQIELIEENCSAHNSRHRTFGVIALC